LQRVTVAQQANDLGGNLRHLCADGAGVVGWQWVRRPDKAREPRKRVARATWNVGHPWIDDTHQFGPGGNRAGCKITGQPQADGAVGSGWGDGQEHQIDKPRLPQSLPEMAVMHRQMRHDSSGVQKPRCGKDRLNGRVLPKGGKVPFIHPRNKGTGQSNAAPERGVIAHRIQDRGWLCGAACQKGAPPGRQQGSRFGGSQVAGQSHGADRFLLAGLCLLYKYVRTNFQSQ
jgi:hypothetical protein